MVELSGNKVILPGLNSNDLTCEIFKFFDSLKAYLTVRSLSKLSKTKSGKLNAFIKPFSPKTDVLEEVELENMAEKLLKLSRMNHFDLQIKIKTVKDDFMEPDKFKICLFKLLSYKAINIKLLSFFRTANILDFSSEDIQVLNLNSGKIRGLKFSGI